ncbi:MAG: hypothetical protein EPO24_12455 [Bacteroidetes bacterium]|nr:MAG: hypothetical protein EPO24_12455 [Bacteroidota bacterium]
MFLPGSQRSRNYYLETTMNVRYYGLALFLVMVCCRFPAFGQTEIQSKQTELSRLRNEIEQYEQKIKETEKKEKATLSLLDQYDKQANLLRKLIKAIHRQEQELEKEIAETRSTIRSLNSQVISLKGHYAKYVTRLYKYGRSHDLELLLASQSLNQSLVRAEYLKKFSDQRKNDLDNIVVQREEIEKENVKLRQQLEAQLELLRQKKKDEITLSDKMKKRRQILAQVRKDKTSLQQDASRIVADAKKLESFIAKLIEEERIRKEREAAAAKANKTPAPTKGTAPIYFSRKSLPWPVAGGKIVARFGNQQHPQLGTVTQNTGIDVAVPVGTSVEAVAEGEVSLISWLPSFGNIVIVDHSGGFRTVYAHLSEITVSEGERIAAKSQLGKSGESLEGAILHFEVWKDREKQNPELWLKPKSLSKQ